MIAQCFYLVALITTVITITFSDVTVYPERIQKVFGNNRLEITNFLPSKVQIGATSISSTTAELEIAIADPVVATMTADVAVNDSYDATRVNMSAWVSGGIRISKEVYDGCRTDTFTVSSCNMTLSSIVDHPSLGTMYLADEDFCESAEDIVSTLLTPKEYSDYPAPKAGTTDIAKSTYLMKFKLVNSFSDSTGMPVEAVFVTKNVLRFVIGSPVGRGLQFDSEHESDVEVFDAIAVLAKLAKKTLNVTLDPKKANSTLVPFADGGIKVPTLRSIIHQAIAEGALVTLQTYVPRGAGIVYDVVINDFQCKYFNTVCSIPVEGGIEVINSRFVGLGDIGTILDNTAGDNVDELLTNVTTAAFKIAGSTFGDRIYLPVF